MNELQLFEPDVAGVYAEFLERCDMSQYAVELTQFFGQLFARADDLACFRCGPMALVVAIKSGMEEYHASWGATCADLVYRLCSGIGRDIGAKEAEAATAKLAFAKRFLEAIDVKLRMAPEVIDLAKDLQGSLEPSVAALGTILVAITEGG
jgi:hypothetical protein